ncbi:MAG: hypothetical protein QOJ15_6853, partial [Bradyrhizobium sp.]|jgi:hypothetical protein|nr:hypothetical protein [Bradyrhizobium sp.]
MVLISAEVHPFAPLPSEPMTVDIVTPEEVPAPKPVELPPEPKAEPSDSFDLSSKAAAAAAASPEAAAAPPQQQAAQPTARPTSQQVAAQAPPPTSPVPAYTPPEPDLTIKYNVLLGLPPDTAPGGFDGPSSPKADAASSLIAAFRRHLRTCSKLPKSVASSEPIRIMLRVFMTTDGKLAREPVLVEASASVQGPALMRSAIGALQACQPYTMLPVDRYGEWKVLDLSFTPQDFAGG